MHSGANYVFLDQHNKKIFFLDFHDVCAVNPPAFQAWLFPQPPGNSKKLLVWQHDVPFANEDMDDPQVSSINYIK